MAIYVMENISTTSLKERKKIKVPDKFNKIYHENALFFKTYKCIRKMKHWSFLYRDISVS